MFYRPPNSDTNYFNKIEDSIGLAVDTGIRDIVVTGDFNLNTLSDLHNRKVASISNSFSLDQCISDPTHFTENSASIIDLLFVSNKSSIVSCGVGDPFLDQNIRYHCPIFAVLKFQKPTFHAHKRKVWKYDAGDYDQLRSKLSDVDWNVIQDNNDIDSQARSLTNIVTEITLSCVPNKDIVIRPAELPWLSSDIKIKIRQRKRAYRRARLLNTDFHWTKFRRLRNDVLLLIRKSKANYFESMAQRLKSNSLSSRDWWKVLKSFINTSSSSGIPPLQNPIDGTLVSEDLQKATLLNDFFVQQTYLDDSNQGLPVLLRDPNQPVLDSIYISPSEVKDVINVLPLGKACGPDGINNKILIESSDVISKPLCDLYNNSLNTSRVPLDWKCSNVCAVFKKGDPSDPSNYRPISLLNTMEKVFERIVFKHVFNFLRDTNFFTASQSGFMPGDSTVNQLTYLYNTFCRALDEGLEVRVIFFDVSKAFDKVWHRGLLLKLENAGIQGNLLSWFSNYLQNRRQRVILPGVSSPLADIMAGVPQGSILGPLLFLVYINDIVNDIGSQINLFADDTSLAIIVDTPDSAGRRLQKDVDTISVWASTWLVKFNPLKSESLVISRKRNKPLHPDVYMHNTPIPSVVSHKHLGVLMSNDGSWHLQLDSVKSKAWSRVDNMKRLRFLLDRKSLEIIYTSFIRPILEYADVVWDNCTQYEKQELEKVQHEAARIVSGCTRLVSIRLLYNEVGWESLETRRTKHKLVLFFKMSKGFCPHYLSQLAPQSVGERSSRVLRNSSDVVGIASRTSFYQNSFLPSVINSWNSLPLETRSAESVDDFKRKLNSDKPVVNSLFYYGKRNLQVLHARLRTDCSSLNKHLFDKNIVQSPLCLCGQIENTYHFLFVCPNFHTQRQTMFTTVGSITDISLRALLYGDDNLSTDNNHIIFDAVHQFISTSKRFEPV